MEKKDFTRQREFIHDISNQLTIAEGSLNNYLKKKTKLHQDFDGKDLEIASQYIRTSVEKIKELRAFIAECENKLNRNL
jgi:polyhydroxyalkanoate synthesis regulator phasin